VNYREQLGHPGYWLKNQTVQLIERAAIQNGRGFHDLPSCSSFSCKRLQALWKMAFPQWMTKNWLPLWKYLNQPISAKLVLNPVHFWYLYRIEHLERCLNKEHEDHHRC